MVFNNFVLKERVQKVIIALIGSCLSSVFFWLMPSDFMVLHHKDLIYAAAMEVGTSKKSNPSENISLAEAEMILSQFPSISYERHYMKPLKDPLTFCLKDSDKETLIASFNVRKTESLINMDDTTRFKFPQGRETAKNQYKREQAVKLKEFENLLEEEKSCSPTTSVNNRPLIGKGTTRNSQHNQAMFEKKGKKTLDTFIYDSFYQNRHLMLSQQRRFRAREVSLREKVEIGMNAKLFRADLALLNKEFDLEKGQLENTERIFLRKLQREYPYYDMSQIPKGILKTIEGGYSLLPDERRQDLRGGYTETYIELNRGVVIEMENYWLLESFYLCRLVNKRIFKQKCQTNLVMDLIEFFVHDCQNISFIMKKLLFSVIGLIRWIFYRN